MKRRESKSSLHWVDGPENEGESTDGTKESLSFAVLASRCRTTIEGKLVNDDEIGNASKRIPAPFLSIATAESSKQTSEDHDHIGNNGNQNVGTAETSQEAKIEKQEWGSDAPVDITGIVDLTIDVVDNIWHMLVLLDNLDLVESDTITGGHCEVGEEGEGGDEGSEDMEEAFFLTSYQ